MRAILAFLLAVPLLTAADLTGSYVWKPVRIDGGGYVTGIIQHPTVPDLRYVRTDVGGAYRWDAASGSWTQLVLAGSGIQTSHGVGIETFAIDRSNPDVLLMAVGGGTSGRLYRSTDRGRSFTVTRFPAVYLGPNDEYRAWGERLEIDPQNGQIAWFGTRRNGLYRSGNGGMDWSAVTAVPLGIPRSGETAGGNKDIGIAVVRCDATSGTLDGRTRRVYAAVNGKGIWHTTDAGQSWAQLAGGPGTAAISDMDVAADGALYITAASNGSIAGGVWRYTPSTSTWAAIAPYAANDWSEVCVDPANAARLWVVRSGGRGLRRSNDRGQNWTEIAWNVRGDAGWINAATPPSIWGWLSIGGIVADPAVPGRLWHAEGFGVWTMDQADTATSASWWSRAKGVEETVTFQALRPAGGPLLTATADLGGFLHDRGVDTPPSTKLITQQFTSCTSLATCATQPQFVAAASTSHLDNSRYSGWSADGGRTWTRFGSITAGTHPAGLDWGNIAISATNPDRMVWVPGERGKPYYTTNRGQSWTPIPAFNGTVDRNGYGIQLLYSLWMSNDRVLCSDAVLADTFYIYLQTEGSVFRSTDGGATFARANSSSPLPAWMFGSGGLYARPGRGGEVWACGGDATGYRGAGLWRSTNSAVTWQRITTIDDARCLAFGAPLAEGRPTAIYAQGVKGGVAGFYRSGDDAATWDLIATTPAGLHDSVKTIDADPDAPGRIYIGLGGTGFVYGEPGHVPINEAPTIATATATATATVTGATLGATASDDGGEPALSYTWSTVTAPTGATVSFVPNATNAAKAAAATVDRVGTYTVRVTARDAGGLTATRDLSFTVVAQITTIAVTPATATITTGGSQAFSAQARDQFAQPLATQPGFAWLASYGTITPAGVFTAPAIGTAMITATAGGRSGSATVSVTYPQGTGTGILREWWLGLSATSSIASLLTETNSFALAPTGSTVIGNSTGGLFETPSGWNDRYGQRLRGWFLPPATGSYTFWIASDDAGELWLSTDADPAKAVRIASVSSYTKSRAWTTHASQRSVAITLTEGQRYYIEARHRENGGGDHLAVGVDLPGGVQERPIPFHRLVPWTPGDLIPPTITGAAAAPATVTGTSTSLSVTATDAVGVTGFAWTAPSGATLSNAAVANPTATFATAGSFTFSVTARDAAGNVSAPRSVTVTVQPTLTAIAVSPATATIAAGASQAFTATARNQFGQALTAQPTVTWSVASGGGTITAGGVYSAPTSAGSATVRATAGTVAGTATLTIATPALPFGWSAADIGGAAAGATSVVGDRWTVTGSGADIWNSADAFRFASTTLNGDGVIIAKVVSQTGTNAWAKAGIMIRETTAAGSRHAMMAATRGNGLAFQYRTSTGGSSSHIAGRAWNPPVWLKLERTGSTLRGWQSLDGVTWTLAGQATIALPSAVHIGLCVTSHDPGQASTAVFEQVQVIPAGAG